MRVKFAFFQVNCGINKVLSTTNFCPVGYCLRGSRTFWTTDVFGQVFFGDRAKYKNNKKRTNILCFLYLKIYFCDIKSEVI